MITDEIEDSLSLTPYGSENVADLMESDERVKKTRPSYNQKTGRRNFDLMTDPFWIISPFKYLEYPAGWADLPIGYGKDVLSKGNETCPIRWQKWSLKEWMPNSLRKSTDKKGNPINLGTLYLQPRTIVQIRENSGGVRIHGGVDIGVAPNVTRVNYIVVPKGFKCKRVLKSFDQSGYGGGSSSYSNEYVSVKVFKIVNGVEVDTHIILGFGHVHDVVDQDSYSPGDRIATAAYGSNTWHLHLETRCDHPYIINNYPDAKKGQGIFPAVSTHRNIPFHQIFRTHADEWSSVEKGGYYDKGNDGYVKKYWDVYRWLNGPFGGRKAHQGELDSQSYFNAQGGFNPVKGNKEEEDPSPRMEIKKVKVTPSVTTQSPTYRKTVTTADK